MPAGVVGRTRIIPSAGRRVYPGAIQSLPGFDADINLHCHAARIQMNVQLLHCALLPCPVAE